MIEILKDKNKESKYIDLINKIESNKNCSCFGLGFNEISFILEMINKQKILVVSQVAQAYKYSTELESLGLRTFVLTSRIENYSYSYFNEYENSKNLTLALFKLLNKEIDVLIVLNKVLIQKVINPQKFRSTVSFIKVNEKLDIITFKNSLVKMGYKPVSELTNPGEFMTRGDLISVFPINFNYPVRISFFDDIVEKISFFSFETYQTLKEEQEIKICPFSFYSFETDFESKILNFIDDEIKNSENDNKKNNLKNLKSEIENRPTKDISSDFVLPFLDNLDSSILDYLIEGLVVYLEPKIIVDSLNDEYVNTISSLSNLISDGTLLNAHKNCIIKKDDVFSSTNTNLAFLNLVTSNKIFNSDEVYSFLSSFVKNYNNNFGFLLEDVRNLFSQNNTIILCANNNEKAIKLNEYFNNNDINSNLITDFSQAKFGIYVLVSNILEGVDFVEDKVIILGNYNIYGTKKLDENYTKLKKVFFTPSVGDYVVHDTFGICLCKKIEKINFNSIEKDYIVLEFAGGDVLYLPSEKANLISKFVGETQNPKLNKLGSDEFNKEKQKVKAKVKELAFNLIELYAKRNKIKGFAFLKDDIVQQEFENAFPFELTLDQQKAVEDIKKDMESEKVMDRLVCGDVGYGKTEVAMRAIFKAILSGKQVAFLCPTTILCEQHYKTCLARMKNFMVNVASLNRFKSAKESKEILQNLKEGKIDLICGTHRLLSGDVVFKDLGLLVLDEEQRFGVSDKEKIKNLKQNIDVLTLSATPIPRTLNMSLIGVRDISIIDTPPKNRIPVQSIVTQFSPNLVSNAVNRELSRGGQVLIVYNRVESINQFAQKFSALFPDAKIAIAHGQMDKKTLENVIMKVYSEEIQILISTVLIENGIDLPKANTIIIMNADKLGLSQLYQLRGRVGRSDKEAFAYFLYEGNKSLTEEGYKRLSALSEFSSLGSGFKIAMRDLEIRGAGSIFGAEQSGHIEKVGIDMYNRLLKQAVDELKGNKTKEFKDLKLEIKLNCFIPKSYIENEEARFDVYEQISNLNSLKTREDFEKLICNKFGDVPSSVINLSYIAVLKNILINFGVKRVVINEESSFIEFYDKSYVDNEKILDILSKNKRNTSLKFKSMPIIEFNFTSDVLSKVKEIINIFVNY